ncbi:MAG: 23S rRNA (uracil(1939)-C(5))-methyltransferase RlmD [Bacteroidales bacterium]|nr:23S rRNA (uracil(1939)-C(5))-methyltransferase RlmD [Bacteroidales bacterium]
MGKKKKTNQIIENLNILGAGSEGVCIGRYEDRVVFVNNVVPGDVADVEVYKKRHSYYLARPLTIKQYSEKRETPRCEHFGICGGCKWQNMQYQYQLYYKQKQVYDNFIRIGKFRFPDINPILASDKIFAYRNKVEYTFADRRWLTKEELETADMNNISGVGFHLPSVFDKVLDIHYCHLHDQTGNEIRDSIKKYALEHGFDFYNARSHEGLLRNIIIRNSVCGDLMVIMVFGRQDENIVPIMEYLHTTFPQISTLSYVVNEKMNDNIADLQVHTFFGRGYMIEQMENLQFKVSPQAFYQTNAEQALKLYQTALRMADIKSSDVVYDLYTGTGTIALFMARTAKKVVAVEYVESAVADAKENAIMNNIQNADFFAGDMKDVLNEDFVSSHGHPDVIVTDPPRAGMHPDVVNTILQIRPKRIVYVSCNPATQARDIALMMPWYKVMEIQPVDMFPHTHHVENVTKLELNQ